MPQASCQPSELSLHLPVLMAILQGRVLTRLGTDGHCPTSWLSAEPQQGGDTEGPAGNWSEPELDVLLITTVPELPTVFF